MTNYSTIYHDADLNFFITNSNIIVIAKSIFISYTDLRVDTIFRALHHVGYN